MRHAAAAIGPAMTLAVAATLLPPASGAPSSCLLAQEPRIVTTVDTTTITVGDRLTLDAIVEHAPDASVLWPDTLDLSPFEVLGVDTLPAGRTGDRARSGLRLVVTAFELGMLEIPALEARVVSTAGDTTTVSSDRWRVAVVSVGLDEEGGIRDIRGPRSIPVGVRTLLPWLAAALAAGLLGWWWLRRHGAAEERATEPAEPARPPHEVALDALAALEAADLPGRGEIKRFHIELSEIVRVYLERRYGVPALETTTGELVAALGSARFGSDLPDEVRHDLRRLLERCDLVKFAKYEPAAEASRELVPVARSVVERTRPARAEADPPEGDGTGDDAPEGVAPEGDPRGGAPGDRGEPDAARTVSSGATPGDVEPAGGGGS